MGSARVVLYLGKALALDVSLNPLQTIRILLLPHTFIHLNTQIYQIPVASAEVRFTY